MLTVSLANVISWTQSNIAQFGRHVAGKRKRPVPMIGNRPLLVVTLWDGTDAPSARERHGRNVRPSSGDMRATFRELHNGATRAGNGNRAADEVNDSGGITDGRNNRVRHRTGTNREGSDCTTTAGPISRTTGRALAADKPRADRRTQSENVIHG